MNKPALDPIADWMLDCLIIGDTKKATALETVYNRMFSRQWKYTFRWRFIK